MQHFFEKLTGLKKNRPFGETQPRWILVPKSKKCPPMPITRRMKKTQPFAFCEAGFKGPWPPSYFLRRKKRKKPLKNRGVLKYTTLIYVTSRSFPESVSKAFFYRTSSNPKISRTSPVTISQNRAGTKINKSNNPNTASVTPASLPKGQHRIFRHVLHQGRKRLPSPFYQPVTISIFSTCPLYDKESRKPGFAKRALMPSLTRAAKCNVAFYVLFLPIYPVWVSVSAFIRYNVS